MRKYTNQQLLDIAKKHIDHFTSAEKWNQYAKEKQLPNVTCYKRYFGSWNTVKTQLNLLIYTNTKKNVVYSTKQLIDILQRNHSIAIKQSYWHAYAKDHHLPSYETIVARFGSWNHALSIAGLLDVKKDIPASTQSPSKQYSYETLKQIARKHLDYFRLRKVWDEYARINNLPSSATYSKYFGSWKEALKAVGIQPTVERPNKYTKKQLVVIACDHQDLLSDSTKWRGYASIRKIPTYQTYIRYFGSWKAVQMEVCKCLQETTNHPI
ncbi:homing endonuclease associated repeat-containing protein [Bacillus sp. EB600]|uniref:homing endonuclease associated repeat-containing protein n=1 Tax=Bacillus sp. EB600 TaxID=2806345 RepID=UPI00210E56F7|nr:hypothetical protein [Bacillus sp. EB600]MCQ6282834.1 hypothetical protein [Bacillus sp. EB600]